ncbi:Membrane associated serine/threonine protein kinase [Halorhabdus sp. SVX81]|uniref:protein kinase n=1 Tax=Halorhabdus sp. SVX81 TaxID=2978283 RepID=UPI0023DBC5F1|nr:protein kinase [Halorhabdus sp. SVX81]WEL16539.1 Membrane associated serine/threonine protein kinase [Halorhabdus sp. SVX81]
MGTETGDGDDATRRAAEPDAEDVLSLVLPSVLDGLAAEARRARVSAAWTACRLADERPQLGAELAARLVRSAGEAHREALVRTLATLHERHPEQVGNALRAFDGTVVRAVRKAGSWDFDAELRADGGATTASGSQHVVETSQPGVSVYERSLPDEPVEPEPPDRIVDDEVESEPEPEPTPDTDGSVPDEPGTPEHVEERRRRIQAAENSEAFAAVQLVSAFDEISVIDPPERGRYGHILPSRARMDQAEYGVDLLFFDEPGEGAREFGSAVHERLHQWYCADEATGIVAVADYGDHPRPWVATPRAEHTLADRRPADLDVALRDARDLAAGLAAVNERGLVHGGIDPHDVVYPSIGFEENPSPSLANLGVMTVFRRHFQPAEYVDPRYAAPEYFDDRYGSVDHATDVYHFGAVLFRLLTGEDPYRGDYDDVRAAILDDETPVPSDVRPDVPEPVDEIVAKAMAPRKLTRFETAAQLHRQLDQLV